MVNKRDKLEKAFKAETDFKEYELDHLLMIGEFIGRNPVFFKKIYKAYKHNETSAYFEPKRGAPITVTFDFKSKEVIINRQKIEIKFMTKQFLRFMELIDTYFSEIIPIGSVVSIDLDEIPESLKLRMSNTNQDALMMIISQNMVLRDHLTGFYADYLAVLWPFGAQERLTPLLVSNMMIKDVLHKGMTNEVEEEFKEKLKSTTVSDNLRSVTYIEEEEVKKLQVKTDMVRKELGSGGES